MSYTPEEFETTLRSLANVEPGFLSQRDLINPQAVRHTKPEAKLYQAVTQWLSFDQEIRDSTERLNWEPKKNAMLSMQIALSKRKQKIAQELLDGYIAKVCEGSLQTFVRKYKEHMEKTNGDYDLRDLAERLTAERFKGEYSIDTLRQIMNLVPSQRSMLEREVSSCQQQLEAFFNKK